MGGASFETDSSEESSEGAIELEFEEHDGTALRCCPVDPSVIDHPTGGQSKLGGVGAAEIYSVGSPQPPPSSVSLGRPRTKAPTASLADGTAESQSAGNAFGIAYKPSRGCLRRGYALPSGPAFADEDEFEQEMSTEFKVVVGPSVQSSDTQTDGSFEDDSTTGGSIGSKQHSGHPLQDIEWRPCAPRSSNMQGVPGGIGSQPLEDAIVVPFHPSRLELDNHKALKQLTEEYQMAGSAPQILERAPPPLDQSAKDRKGGHTDSGPAADAASILEYVSQDVRHYPVIEEEDGQAEEEEEENGAEGKGFGGNSKEEGTLRDQEKQEKEERPNKKEDEVSRRALVAREWEAIDQLRTAESSVPMEKGVGGKLQPICIDQTNCLITTDEDLTAHKAAIVPFQPPQSRFGLFRRSPTLNFPDGKHLRDEVFILAQIKYAPADVVHRRLIQTIYRRMTNEKRSCPDVGPHWDTIGFQGTDPCTDLNRSMGVFALFQVLHLLETQLAFAMNLYRLSLANVTRWPFLCVSIGFTKEAVGVLRRGSCYSECKRRASVLEVVNELHQAQFHAFFELCRNKPSIHHALHLAEVRARVETDSRVLVKAYRAYLSEERAKSAVSVVEKTGGGVVHKLLEVSDGRTMADKGRPAVHVEVAANRQKHYLSEERTPVGL